MNWPGCVDAPGICTQIVMFDTKTAALFKGEDTPLGDLYEQR